MDYKDEILRLVRKIDNDKFLRRIWISLKEYVREEGEKQDGQ